MTEKHFVCIACPNSCKLTVTEGQDGITVTGATCKRGIEHGKNEYTRPMRMLTTTVAINGGVHPRIAVVSENEIPKDQMNACLEYLYGLEVEAPVTKGDVIVSNICGTGTDIIASRSMRTK